MTPRTTGLLRGTRTASAAALVLGSLVLAGAGTASGSAATDPGEQDSAVPALHSLPGSHHTIYLDFTGADVSGTDWPALANRRQPAYDTDGDPGSFSPAEQRDVYQIWSQVASNFAPFDVDVTTVDPGTAAIDRTSSADDDYGTTVLITPSPSAAAVICGAAAGRRTDARVGRDAAAQDPGAIARCDGTDAAFSDAFDRTTEHQQHQPAWVFTAGAAQLYRVRTIGEQVSHAVGWEFGLTDDSSDTYGSGGPASTNGWTAIMDAGSHYTGGPSSWTDGDYPGANQHVDEMAVIAAHGAPFRDDDAPDTLDDVQSSTPVVSATGVIGPDGDVDYYKLGPCVTPDVAVFSSYAATDLDLSVQIAGEYYPDVSFDPDNVELTGEDVPYVQLVRGLDASETGQTPLNDSVAQYYYVRVAGGSIGPDSTYGSVGAYTLRSACASRSDQRDDPLGPVRYPVASRDLQRGTLDVAWVAPTADDPLNGETVVELDHSSDPQTPRHITDTIETSVALTGVGPGNHVLTITPSSGGRTGTPLTLRRPAPATDLAAELTDPSGEVRLSWTPPSDTGGVRLDPYDVEDAGPSGTHQYSADVGARVVLFDGLEPGRHTFTLRAINDLGESDPVHASVVVPTPPSKPGPPRHVTATVRRTGHGRVQTQVTWRPPVDDGGTPVTGYRVETVVLDSDGRMLRFRPSPWLPAGRRSLLLRVDPTSRYRFAVQARNGAGFGPWSTHVRATRR